METVKKITFNHDSDSVTIAIGLTDGEGESINERVMELFEREPTITGVMEVVAEEFTGAHLMLALYLIGCNKQRQLPSMDEMFGGLFG